MDSFSLANLLDALGKAGVLGAAALVIWALMTERLVTRARIESERRLWEDRLRSEHDRRETMRAGLMERIAEGNVRWVEERQRLLATLAAHESRFATLLQMLQTMDDRIEHLSEQIDSSKLLEAVQRAEDAKRREERKRQLQPLRRREDQDEAT